MLIDEKGEKSAIAILKGIAPKFFVGFNNSKTIRQKIVSNCNSIADLKSIINEILNYN